MSTDAFVAGTAWVNAAVTTAGLTRDW